MLTIYKASAGSGKTYQLAVEYIALLVLQPTDYRRILAVTFTNKATEEMKTRIVNQLYAISHALPSGDAMLQSVREKLAMHVGQWEAQARYDDAAIRRNASKALSLILHNYSFFRVQTIDAFFMGVLRNLAHELGLSANLRVGLNDVEVEAKAVDSLIERLQKGQGGKKNELDWIIEYIMKKIADNKSWKVIDLLKQFGKHIFDDTYKERVAERPEAFDIDYPDYIGHLRAEREKAEKAARAKMLALLKKITDDGRYTKDEDYKGKSRGVLAYIRKVADGTQEMGKETSAVACNCMLCGEAWVGPKHKKGGAMLTFVEDELINDFIDAEEEWQRQGEIYLSASLTLANLDKLRLLRSIAERVHEQNRYMNRFQLSDTQTLLKRFIQDRTDAPFVYEKTGATLRHIMIDEFQDTSSMQWQNFKVLLDDCNATAGSHNIIVGDVKQSIYRWRGGDWKLLNDMTLPEQLARHKDRKVEVMGKNYRSLWGVVHFNNWFFRGAARQEAAMLEEEAGQTQHGAAPSQRGAAATVAVASASSQQGAAPSQRGASTTAEVGAGADLTHAYDHCEQEAVKEAQGSVCVELLKGGNDITEPMLQRVGYHVQKLLAQGVAQRDIAILVRNNSHPHDVADYFSRTKGLQDVTLVSDQAFLLDTSLAVNTIISAMALLQHPDDMVLRAQLVKYYQRYILNNEGMTDSRLFVGNDLLKLLPMEYARAVTNEQEAAVTNEQEAVINEQETAVTNEQEAVINEQETAVTTEQEAATNGEGAMDGEARWMECRSRREELLSMPMLELIDHLHQCFGLKNVKGEDAYLCAFRDNVVEYLQDHVADIDALLNYWDETLHAKSIQSDATDGIRILTIHKSKGLQYPYVIVPFADWKMEHTSDTLWCDTDGLPDPFSHLPLVPIDYSKKMLRSVYAPHYEEEHKQNVVDNLNMLYVALTRAERGLVVIGKWTANDKGEVNASTRSGLLTQWMLQCTKKPLTSKWDELEKWQSCFKISDDSKENDAPDDSDGNSNDSSVNSSVNSGGNGIGSDGSGCGSDGNCCGSDGSDEPAMNVFTYGTLAVGDEPEKQQQKKEKEKAKDEEQRTAAQRPNPFDVKPVDVPVVFRTAGKCASFKCSNDSRRFISSDDDAARDEYISLGNVVHEVLSHITTLTDGDPGREVDALLDELEMEGILDVAGNRQRARQMILNGLRQPEVRAWFSGDWQLFNECSILHRGSDGVVKVHRPDRVMVRGGQAVVVDFKTGAPYKKHQTQVQGYMQLLRQMGYGEVSGYLWYTAQGRVEEVSLWTE